MCHSVLGSAKTAQAALLLAMGGMITSSTHPASRTGRPALLEVRWRHETAKLALDQRGELDRGAVFEPRADDLYSDWQARRRDLDRRRRRGQAGNRRDAGPDHLIFIRIVLAIDLDDPFVALGGVVVGECRRRHSRAEHDIPFPEQLVPLLPQPDAGAVGRNPVAMAEGHTTPAPSYEAVVARWQRCRSLCHAAIEIRRPIGGEKRKQQLHVKPGQGSEFG